MILCLCFLFLYLLEGVIFNFVYKISGYWIDDFGLLDEEVTQVTTFSYIPFIIGCTVFIGYIIAYNLLKVQKDGVQNDGAQSGGAQKENEQTRNYNISDQQQIAEILKSYKELLGMGIITQEEFNREKEKLLK